LNCIQTDTQEVYRLDFLPLRRVSDNLQIDKKVNSLNKLLQQQQQQQQHQQQQQQQQQCQLQFKQCRSSAT